MAGLELCFICNNATGRAGPADDSIYFTHGGPYCEECRDELFREVEDYTEHTLSESDQDTEVRRAIKAALEMASAVAVEVMGKVTVDDVLARMKGDAANAD